MSSLLNINKYKLNINQDISLNEPSVDELSSHAGLHFIADYFLNLHRMLLYHRIFYDFTLISVYFADVWVIHEGVCLLKACKTRAIFSNFHV